MQVTSHVCAVKPRETGHRGRSMVVAMVAMVARPRKEEGRKEGEEGVAEGLEAGPHHPWSRVLLFALFKHGG